MSNPSTTIQSEKMFWLRLTTVIEADYGIEAIAPRRTHRPLSSTILRRVDARDHFHYDVVDGSSAFNPSPGTDQVVARRLRRRGDACLPASFRTRVPAARGRGHDPDAGRLHSDRRSNFPDQRPRCLAARERRDRTRRGTELSLRRGPHLGFSGKQAVDDPCNSPTADWNLNVPDSRIERERQKALRGVLDRIAPFVTDGSAARPGHDDNRQTYPTTAGAFYASNPTEIDGSEVEGATASYTADTSQVVYVLNVGTQVPPLGTRVIAHAVGGRWVFRYDG